MLKIVYVLLITQPNLGDMAKVAEYSTKAACMESRRMVLDNDLGALYHADCIPISNQNRVHEGLGHTGKGG